jgi:hypothetical protein
LVLGFDLDGAGSTGTQTAVSATANIYATAMATDITPMAGAEGGKIKQLNMKAR